MGGVTLHLHHSYPPRSSAPPPLVSSPQRWRRTLNHRSASHFSRLEGGVRVPQKRDNDIHMHKHKNGTVNYPVIAGRHQLINHEEIRHLFISQLNKVTAEECFFLTRSEIMVMWLKVPRLLCFRGAVMKNVLQSLEYSGSSFWGNRNTGNVKYFIAISWTDVPLGGASCLLVCRRHRAHLTIKPLLWCHHIFLERQRETRKHGECTFPSAAGRGERTEGNSAVLTTVQMPVTTSQSERIDVFWARLTQRTLSLCGPTHVTIVM